MEKGCESHPGRVQVQPLYVLAAGHLEEGKDGHQLHPQQKVSQGHQGHVHGEFSLTTLFGQISPEFSRKSIFKKRNNLISREFL